MKGHAVEWLKKLVLYGVGFGLLAIVIAVYWNDKDGKPGLKTLLERPISYEWFGATAVLIASAFCLQIIRWYLLVRALDLPFTLRNAFRLGMVGMFANTFIPGSVGGDLLKAYFIAKDSPGRRTAAVATVLIDRAMGLFGLILFVAVMGSIAWANGDERIKANVDLQWIVKLMALISGSSIVGFLLLGLLPQRRVDRFAGRLNHVPKLGHSLAEFWYAVWMYRQRMKVVVMGVALSAGSHFALVFAFHFAGQVFPPDNPTTDLATLSEHMVIAPIGFIAQALPISPGGVGVGEAAFAGLYKLSGRPESRGVVARLSMRLVEWAISLLGLIVFLRMRKELPNEAAIKGLQSGEPPS